MGEELQGTMIQNNLDSNALSTNKQGQTNKTNNKSRNRKGRGQNQSNNFIGMTPEMGGHVFQIHSKHKLRTQFDKTLSALELYASKIYQNDMVYLHDIFKNLGAPKLTEPEAPEGTKLVKTKTVDGVETEEGVMTEVQRLMYTKRLKTYINQEELLKSTMMGLYNVIIGQCSKMTKTTLDA